MAEFWQYDKELGYGVPPLGGKGRLPWVPPKGGTPYKPTYGGYRQFECCGWLLLCIGLLLCAAQSFAAEPKFSATLDRDTILAGETATLTLTFEGVSPQGMPTIPAIPGLTQVGRPASSFNTTIVNGEASSTVSFSVPLRADKAGEYVIPQFTVNVGGKQLQSTPLTLKVTAAPAVTEQSNRPAFLTIVLPKKEIYVGEVLVPEMRLFVRADLQFGDAQIPPLRGDGFTAGQFIRGQDFQKQVGNVMYNVVPVSAALVPVKAGLLTINAINGTITVAVPSSNPIDQLLGRAAGKQVALSIGEQNLTVLPLPSTNVPAGFSGAVGNFRMDFTAGPTNIAAGEPITVNVRITGRGNFDAVTLPEQAAWRDFKTYPPKIDFKASDKFNVAGIKTFEEVISPESADIKEIPGFVFSFFNPDKKTYETLSKPAIPLMVRAGAAAVAPSVVTSRQSQGENAAPPAQDIVPIKDHIGAVAQATVPLVEKPWFIALQAIPVLAFIGALVWRRRSDSLANNPRLRRQRMVAQIVQEGIGTLRRLAAENRSDDFFATLFRLLQEQLGERLNVPASAITEAVIEENLRPRGAPESVIQPLHELFQTCNLARYAPIKSSQELAALVPKAEQVLKDLRELKL
jgi:hypothetical protein